MTIPGDDMSTDTTEQAAPAWWSDPAALEELLLGVLAKHDMHAVDIVLRRMAILDPRRCADLVTVMKAGLLIAADTNRSAQ